MISLETLALAKRYTQQYVNEHGGDGGGSYVRYDSTAGWNAQQQLISVRGVIYIYSDHGSVTTESGDVLPVPGFKVGDGNSYLIDLPFASEREIKEIEDAVDEIADEVAVMSEQLETVTEQLDAHTADEETHVSTEEKDTWNSKISVRFDQEDSENLILF